VGKLKLKSKHRVLCGDSTSETDVARLMRGENADLCLTDPPYGIDITNQSQGDGGGVAKKIKYSCSSSWDKEIPKSAIVSAIKNASNSILWGANYYTDILPTSSCWFIWDKDNGETDFADAELAWTSFDSSVRLFQWKWRGMIQQDMKNKEKRLHPTQKPIPLFVWCLKKTDAKVVFDPFLGSGTTLIACEQLNRQCYGMEIDPLYCDVIVKRWENLTGETAQCESVAPTK